MSYAIALEASLLGSRRHSGCLKLGVVACLGLGRWDVADRLEEAAVVVPVDPLQGGELNLLQAAPRATPPDHLGLEQAIDRLGKRVVVAVTDAADGGLDTSFEQPLCVPNRNVLATPVAVMNEAALHWSAVVQRLLQSIEDKVGMRRPRNAPADDAAGENIDDEGHVHEALPGRDIG